MGCQGGRVSRGNDGGRVCVLRPGEVVPPMEEQYFIFELYSRKQSDVVSLLFVITPLGNRQDLSFPKYNNHQQSQAPS